ncbi:hypothetical protein MSG28_015034 [Choristoneura fumiferana]|uniref:Uncharacterized protein n=1 Tax=Choristoneura fumiferana TaxID=7141 RepID=A0ACC0KZB9_CHOFU|nr:hypothetical protein MSG28_015034 [Choristoneura fumiferana]
MEGLFDQRMTPILKCVVLFLFIFTARVLTSRPQEAQESKNSIHQIKPYHYVRTFTKYHHRRTIQWSNLQDYWPDTQEHPKVIGKRSIQSFNSDSDWPGIKKIKKRSLSVSIPNLNEFVKPESLGQLSSESNGASITDSFDRNAISYGKQDSNKNGLPNDIKILKEKAEVPTTASPKVCLYKINNVARSATPNYDDEKNAQVMVENEGVDIPGEISETTLPNGEAAQIERCTDPRAICYTLFHRDKIGNITVLGQGCWKSSPKECDKCQRVTARLPGTRFCCCTKSYCNADFTSQKEEVVTPKAESTVRTAASQPNYSNAVASAVLALVVILVMAIVLNKFYCKKPEDDKEDLSSGGDVEKGDVMGTGPDALATGLSCVDNLTLIEHIGQGKFGSVWRGSLGTTPVAVKLYSSASAWQKEAAIYALPHLAHPNILKYYGSDSRPALEGGPRSHLIVVELCESTLRARLERAPLTWAEFATLAHGLSGALAHLHTTSEYSRQHAAGASGTYFSGSDSLSAPSKPCIVHRDVNSANVLVRDGRARLADLGLAQVLAKNKRANSACLVEVSLPRGP